MELLVSGISLVMERKDSRRIIILGAGALLFLFLATQNEGNSENIWNIGTFILTTLGSLVGGINLSLAYTYIHLRIENSKLDTSHDNIGIAWSIIGMGKVVWGITFISILLSFLGFSAMVDFLPYEGQEIGYIGLIILLIATYTLARKVATPNVC